ncbi:MAG: VPLPA-CTERM sorting domain-containing protein [Pseudomonadota bacterium]
MTLLKTVFGAALVTGALSATSAFAASTTYDGILFPDGDISFADSVKSLNFGNPQPTNTSSLNPLNAVGAPDSTSVSLGRGGVIVVEFTDNALTGSGNSDADLHIFEIGSDVEDTFVEISQDGINFIDVGKVFGSTSSIDIDPFLAAEGLLSSALFTFVRLTDDPNEGQSSGQFVGADIDAVGAISSAPPPTPIVAPVPLPAGLVLGATAFAALGVARRRRKA